jgi:hypothetical protein
LLRVLVDDHRAVLGEAERNADGPAIADAEKRSPASSLGPFDVRSEVTRESVDWRVAVWCPEATFDGAGSDVAVRARPSPCFDQHHESVTHGGRGISGMQMDL